MEIRFAAETDAPALLAIYAQYIETGITFEYQLPTPEEFAQRIREFGGTYPYLVCEESGRIVGYAYAHRQAERAAYQWNAELSVYLDRDHTGTGLGKRLYHALMELLLLQGVRTVYALVTLPNEKSEGLHRSMGFRLMGVQRSTGYKAGAWRDVAWFELPIADYDQGPAPLRPLPQVPPEQVAAVLRQA